MESIHDGFRSLSRVNSISSSQENINILIVLTSHPGRFVPSFLYFNIFIGNGANKLWARDLKASAQFVIT